MDPNFELSSCSSTSQPHAPPDSLCPNGCGRLVSSPNTRGLCSHCYNISRHEEKTAKIEARKSPSSSPSPSDNSRTKVSLESEIAADSTPLKDPATGADDPPAAKARCNLCRRKLPLLRFPCRCGGGFCNTHRHPEAHACKFDYRKAGKRTIENQNPLVRADKMARRI